MSPNPDSTEPKGRELIAFWVAGQEFCVDIAQVRELRGWTPATPLPHAPDYVRGVINLRGTVLPVVDLGARLGLPVADPTRRHVIIVVWIGSQVVGLLVDAVSDILMAAEDDFQPTPDMACDAVQGLVSRLLNIEERMIGLISLDRVLPAIEAQAA